MDAIVELKHRAARPTQEEAEEAEPAAEVDADEPPAEEEEVAAEDDGGCGSCAVGPSGSSVPPKSGLFLVAFALLVGLRLRSHQARADLA